MRGIGCLLMIVVPAFAYTLGDFLAGRGFGSQLLPREWYVGMTFPPVLYTLQGLRGILDFLTGIPHLPANLAIAVAIMIIVGGILSVLFGWMYSLFAPSPYGPFDVPPPRVKTKKYKR